MKDSTKKTVEGYGRFFGAAAYGFVYGLIYAPIIMVREIKEVRTINNKKRTAI